jgi:hypothetical protein
MTSKEIQFAKTHLRNHLATTILPHISDGIWSIYENAHTLCEKNREVEQTLRTFQNLLTRVSVWTDEVLRQEVERIEAASKCNYLEELLTGVFLAYMRAFAAMQYRSSADAIEIEFDKPTIDKFVHELYKQSARNAWQHAYLFKTFGVPSEQQARNRKEIEVLLESALDTVIDSFLPWKDIAKNYFKEVQMPPSAAAVMGGGDQDDEDDEEEHAPPPTPKAVTFSGGDDDDEPPVIEIGDDAGSVDLGIESLEMPTLAAPSADETVELSVGDDSGTLVLKE